MYFDPRPKTSKDDLFNRLDELARFSEALSYASLIVVSGLRRTGKTSFINVALAESGCPYIFMDMRGLPYNPSHAEIVRRLETSFSRIDRRWLSSLSRALTHVKGVSVLGTTISMDWGKQGVSLADLFDEIDIWAKKEGKRFLAAFDETQIIRGDKSIPRLFAHIMDMNHSTSLVVSGSEVGLLFGFLGFDDPDSPLYGRHYTEIKMRNFEYEEAREFLELGLQQIGVSASSEVLDYVLGRLDGVVGWLTLFGAKCRDSHESDVEIADAVIAEGGNLARAEALRLVNLSRRYGVVLNFLAKVRTASWTQIKAVMEAHENRSLPNPTVAGALNRLMETSFVSKENGEYSIADPILAHGILRDPLPTE